MLPMHSSIPERRVRDHKRNGTTSPLVDPDVAIGFVIGKRRRRDRSKEFPDFPKEIDARVPKGPDVHIVIDNYATHRTAAIGALLARRPHWGVRFTPPPAPQPS